MQENLKKNKSLNATSTFHKIQRTSKASASGGNFLSENYEKSEVYSVAIRFTEISARQGKEINFTLRNTKKKAVIAAWDCIASLRFVIQRKKPSSRRLFFHSISLFDF